MVCGGQSMVGDPVDSCEAYEPSSDKWSPFPSMNFKRRELQLLKWNDSIYAIGVWDNGKGLGKDSIERFDSATGRWSVLPTSLSLWRRDFFAVAI